MTGSSGTVRRSVPAAGLVLLAVLALPAGAASAVGAVDGATATPDGATVNLYHAANVSFDDAADVEAAIADGTLEPADEVVVGERLVVAIGSDRLAESMADGDGSTTDRFLDALRGDAALRIAQTNPTPERPRKVASVGRENVTAYRAGTTTYAVVDTGALDLRYRGEANQPAPLWDGDRFAVTFGYDLEEHDVSGPEFDLYTTAASVYTLDANDPLAPEVVDLSVMVNVDPDEAVVARLTLGESRRITATVEPVPWTGFQGVSLDLRDVEPGTGYTLELLHDGTVVDRYEGTVLEPRARLTNVTLTEVETEHLVTRSGQRVTETITDHAAVNATVKLSHGGQVRVYDESCEKVGTERVEPGVETRLSVELWSDGAPIRGRNASEYGVLVRAVRDVEQGDRVRYPGPDAETAVNVAGAECRSTAPTPTETAPSTPPDDPTETGTSASPDGGTATPGQPGFTGLAALVALLAMVLVGTRRR